MMPKGTEGAIPTFEICFHALTRYNLMRWQLRFFKQMLSGDIPQACDLPTGLGKTSVIPIWLIALASQDRGPGIRPLPRRLVYIVNRRTVVDQATHVVEDMRERLQNPQKGRWAIHNETLSALKRDLQAMSANSNNEEVFGVSTLREELADSAASRARVRSNRCTAQVQNRKEKRTAFPRKTRRHVQRSVQASNWRQ